MLGIGPHRKSKDLAASEVSKAEVWHLLKRRPHIFLQLSRLWWKDSLLAHPRAKRLLPRSYVYSTEMRRIAKRQGGTLTSFWSLKVLELLGELLRELPEVDFYYRTSWRRCISLQPDWIQLWQIHPLEQIFPNNPQSKTWQWFGFGAASSETFLEC